MGKISRREFLRRAAWTAFGSAFLPFAFSGTAEAGISEDDPGPYVYKRFLRFSEYVERPTTKRIVIHHTEISDMSRGGTAAQIHEMHKRNGWAGIGYHYFIRPDGMIEQGRRPPMVGAHAWQNNHDTIGVCLAGNFDQDRPTPEQMEAAKELTAWLCRRYRLDPGKRGVIVGHRDVNDDTTCPGKYLYPKLPSIRAYCMENV